MSVCSECTKTTADSSWNYKNIIFIDIEESNINQLILENISTVEDNFPLNLTEIIDKLNINEEKDTS